MEPGCSWRRVGGGRREHVVVGAGGRRQQHGSDQGVTATALFQWRARFRVHRWLFLGYCRLGSVSPSSVELYACLGAGLHELWGKGPVVAFAWRVVFVPRQFNKALIEGEIVPDGILPSSSVLAVEWKSIHDVVVDLIQCELFPWRSLNCH